MPALTHGRVLTMDPACPQAEAILWEEGTIVLVGSNQEIEAEAARRGITPARADGLVMPGFVDGHMHFMHVGIRRTRPDLAPAKSRQEALAIVAAFLEAHEGAVTAEGWDESHWPDGRPHKDDLDALAPDRPLVMRRICGHVSVANTAALEIVLQHWDDPEKVHPATGLLLEEPSLFLNEVLPEPPERLAVALAKATEVAHALGVTSIGTYEQTPMRRALENAASDGTLGVRVACHIYPQAFDAAMEEGFQTGRRSGFYQDGGMKVFLDGSLGGHSAYLREPYVDKETRGIQNFTDAELDHLFQTAAAAGIQVHAHVIGDGAVDQGLDAYARSRAVDPSSHARLRPRFEHYEIVHDDQVARTAELGIHCCAQPNFVGVWSAKGGMYEERLGERFHVNNRFNSFRKAGIELSFGSDGMPFGPLFGLACALEHPLENERPTLEDALGLYTREAARGLHMDTGVLAPGAPADILVIQDEGSPKKWIIRQTIQDGKVVHEGTTPLAADLH